MDAWRFFAGMFGTLLVFAAASLFLTGSVLWTLLETFAAAVILQIGYFICIAVLVRQAAGAKGGASIQRLPEDPDQKSREGSIGIASPALKHRGTIG